MVPFDVSLGWLTAGIVGPAAEPTAGKGKYCLLRKPGRMPSRSFSRLERRMAGGAFTGLLGGSAILHQLRREALPDGDPCELPNP
jgi:hypothetical protein